MASLSKEGTKQWRIQFVDIAGSKTRKQVRLYNVTKKQAEGAFHHIEGIISAKLQGTRLDDADAKWLSEVPDGFHAKLVKAGLTEPRELAEPEPEIPQLGQFLEEFYTAGKTAKDEAASKNTKANWLGTMRFLNAVLGEDQPIDAITHENAYQFRKWLDERRIKKSKRHPKGKPMAENAKRKHVSNAKTFFNAAKRRRFIQNNPFEFAVSGSKANRDRDFYLTPEATAQIIGVCPDAQWRLLTALWRYAGLRKMEVMWLTWDDVEWDQGKMKVHATKTAHHEGGEIRYVPLRDISEYLKAVRDAAPAGESQIITRFSESNSNLDKPFKAILDTAGVAPWPKLFQNMRASCETDWLNEGLPQHVVAGWVGHSVKVQRMNYAQITEGHFEAFNNGQKRSPDFGSLTGSDQVRTGQNGRELAHIVAHSSPSKNAGEQCFSASNGRKRVPRAGRYPHNQRKRLREVPGVTQ